MSNVIRVVKNCNYTTLSNYHFKDKRLSWKAKGLLSTMLSLPDNWNYTIEGLASLSDDGVKATNNLPCRIGEMRLFNQKAASRQ